MSYVIIDNQLVKVESTDGKNKKKTTSVSIAKTKKEKPVKMSRKDKKREKKEKEKKGKKKNMFKEEESTSDEKKRGKKGKKLTRTMSTVQAKELRGRSDGPLPISGEIGQGKSSHKKKKFELMSQEEVDAMDDQAVETAFVGKLDALGMAQEQSRFIHVDDMRMYLVGTLDLEGDQKEMQVHVKALEKMTKKNNINLEQLVNLRSYITDMNSIWLYEFKDKGGLADLVEVHDDAIVKQDIESLLECARIIRLMLTIQSSSYNVFAHIFSTDGVSKNIVNTLAYMNEISKADMMRVLAAVAGSDRNFWRRVFDEFYVLGFDILVDPVLESYNHNVELSTMNLINALMRGFTDEQQAFFVEVDDRLGSMSKLEESAKVSPELGDELRSYLRMRDEFSPKTNSTAQKLQDEQVDILKNRVAKQKREIQRLKNLVRDAEDIIAEQQAASAIGATIPTLKLDTSVVDVPQQRKQKIKIFGKKKKRGESEAPVPDTTSTPVNQVVTAIPVPSIIPASVVPAPPSIMGGGLPPPPPPPPPPGMGGIPPPPGMGTKGGKPPKPVINPKKKMRAFNWSKIHPTKLKDTIWDKATDEGVVVEAAILEDYFGTDPFVKPIGKKEDDEKKKKAKPQKISLLPAKKATNVEIMLRGLKRDHEDISKCLRRLPEGAFTVEELEAIQKNLPEEEEAAALKGFTGNEDKLAPGDQYFLTLLTIPFLNERVSSMIYQFNFDYTIDVIRKKTEMISGATDTIANDERFISFLEVTLAIGNYMNGGTNRGGIYGFKLSSLSKLMDVRSVTNGRYTLLHYMVDYISERDKEILDLFREFDDVHLAIKDNLDDIKVEVKKLILGLQPIISIMENPKCDKYLKRAIGPWIPHAEEVLQRTENYFLRTETDFNKMLVTFAESGTKSHQFFSMMSKFGKQVEECIRDNIANRAQNKRDKERREKNAKNQGPQMMSVDKDELAGILNNMRGET